MLVCVGVIAMIVSVGVIATIMGGSDRNDNG